jgi:hypothetical protein
MLVTKLFINKNKLSICLLFIILTVLNNKVLCQNTFQKEILGASGPGQISSIVSVFETSNNTYYLANNQNSQAHLITLNTTTGDILNNIKFSNTIANLRVNGSVNIADNTYIIINSSVIKYSLTSNSILWNKKIQFDNYNEVATMAITTDNINNLYVVGNLLDPNTGIGTMYVTKIDTNGMLVWTKFIHQTDTDIQPNSIVFKNNREIYISSSCYYDYTFNTSAQNFRLDEFGNILNSTSKISTTNARMYNSAIGILDNHLCSIESSAVGADGIGPTRIDKLDSNLNVISSYQLSGFRIETATILKNKIILAGQGDVYAGYSNFKTIRLDSNLTVNASRQYNHVAPNSILVSAKGYLTNANNSIYFFKTNQNSSFFIAKTDNQEVISCSNLPYTPVTAVLNYNSSVFNTDMFTTSTSLINFTNISVAPDNSLTVDNACQKFILENPLPLELTSFNATSTTCNVTINWSTAAEKDVLSFNILRKKSNESIFTKVGSIQAKGNTTNEQWYNFVDQTVETGSYDYKLETVDISTLKSESKLANTSVNCLPTDAINLYPNPAKNTINITVLDSKKINSIKLTDIYGQVIFSSNNSLFQHNIAQYNVSALANGTYLLQLENVDTGVSSMKVIIQK